MREIHGIEVPFETPPRRVVSLIPCLTLSMFEVNLGRRLVGRTDFCTEPAGQVERLPSVGAPHGPDIERVLALRPDLILADEDSTRDEDVAALEAAGLTVWVLKPRLARDSISILWALMYAFDDATMVPRVRAIDQAMDYLELASQNEERTRPRVFVPLWRDPWMTFNRDTYSHDLLRICGADNVFGDLGERYGEVGEEAITAAQPDIALLPYNEPYAFDEADAADLQALGIPRVHLVDGRWLIWYGTEVTRATTELPRLFMLED